MFKEFFKRNYKNDVYKVEIINLNEDNEADLKKEIEVKNQRIRQKINERKTASCFTILSGLLVIIGLVHFLLILIKLYPYLGNDNENNQIIYVLFNYVEGIGLPFLLFYLPFFGNIFYNSCIERRHIEDDIYSLGLDLYKTHKLEKDIKSFFKKSILKEYKESKTNKIKKWIKNLLKIS